MRAPLAEAGLTKDDIRVLSRRRGLPKWDKPFLRVFASRFPKESRCRRGAAARRAGGGMPARPRVQAVPARRHHGDLCRIEVDPADLPRMLEPGLPRTACGNPARPGLPPRHGGPGGLPHRQHGVGEIRPIRRVGTDLSAPCPPHSISRSIFSRLTGFTSRTIHSRMARAGFVSWGAERNSSFHPQPLRDNREQSAATRLRCRR